MRVIRLPRHGASCPVGLGVSCSADRQVLGKITKSGVSSCYNLNMWYSVFERVYIYIEQLEEDPSKYLPEVKESQLSDTVVKVDLNQPMSE